MAKGVYKFFILLSTLPLVFLVFFFFYSSIAVMLENKKWKAQREISGFQIRIPLYVYNGITQDNDFKKWFVWNRYKKFDGRHFYLKLSFFLFWKCGNHFYQIRSYFDPYNQIFHSILILSIKNKISNLFSCYTYVKY